MWQGARTYVPRAQAPVASALRRFTTRFGMGRGGTTAQATHPVAKGQGDCPTLPTAASVSIQGHLPHLAGPTARGLRGKPSTVRTRSLHVLPRVQPEPLGPLISRESYLAIPVRALIFRCISHLDAFSGSCSRT
jgi:hypothetical protein